MAKIEITCVEANCNATFTVSDGEQRWYEERGLSLPKRCKACRSARKGEKARRGTEREGNPPTPEGRRGGRGQREHRRSRYDDD
jgi:hypothetical protein